MKLKDVLGEFRINSPDTIRGWFYEQKDKRVGRMGDQKTK